MHRRRPISSRCHCWPWCCWSRRRSGLSARPARRAEPLPNDPGGTRTWPARVGSVVVVLLTWTLWVPDLFALLPFAVTLLGRLPVVTPTWVYPAVFFFAGILLWPPLLAVLIGRVRWRLAHGVAAGVLMLALVATGILSWMAPAYTAERPQQRSVLFVEDRIRGNAHWDLSSNEPGRRHRARRPGQRRLACGGSPGIPDRTQPQGPPVPRQRAVTRDAASGHHHRDRDPEAGRRRHRDRRDATRRRVAARRIRPARGHRARPGRRSSAARAVAAGRRGTRTCRRTA